MFSLNGTLKKKWVGRAMGNETIYWDGLINKITVTVVGEFEPFLSLKFWSKVCSGFFG